MVLFKCINGLAILVCFMLMPYMKYSGQSLKKMKLLYLVALILSAIFSFCHQDYLCKLASVLMVMGALMVAGNIPVTALTSWRRVAMIVIYLGIAFQLLDILAYSFGQLL
ncbi:Uncharacterised protein [Streptococcus acidominimus]|uniref:Uncharacterized protein n=3 Tax=Streptococcus TaxID=1301 RepID=A0A239XBA9_STRAI|nr:Uncharacterised protein [Streptococcus acidominimus]